MTITQTARRLAALTLAIGAVWLWGVRASADTADYGDAETDALIHELPDVIKEYPMVEQEADYHGKTVILHSNDTMGALEGFPRMAWLKREFERMGAETILADAGNFSMGSVYADSEGAAALKLMNLTGYNVAGLGRFEFSYGYDIMRRNLRRAAFPVLCANAMESGETICAPNYSYTTKSGLTIGFFGLITPKAEGNLNLISGHDIEIYKRKDIYKCVQAQIDALRQPGSVIPAADLVIGLSNLGSHEEHTAAGYDSLSVFSKTEGLDMILDAASDRSTGVRSDNTPVQSCGEKFAYIGVVVIDNAAKSIEDHYLIDAETLESDETVSRAVETLQNQYQVGYNSILARSETPLNGEKAPGNRTEETNLGDLIADAMVWTARKELKKTLTDEAHIIGLTNGAAIRANIPEGNITRNHVKTAYPFADTLAVVYVTGAELLETLEACTSSLPEKYCNCYPQTCGIAFTLDERIPYDAGEEYGDSGVFRPATIRRVRVDSVRGQPFDPNALYAIVTNSYCAAGGSAYYLLGAAKERFESDTVIEQSITDYMRYGLGGVVTEARYGAPRGDHTILT